MKVSGLGKAAIEMMVFTVLLIVCNPWPTPAWADAERHTTFVAQSRAATIDGVAHQIVMEGRVVFDPEEQEVEGGGNFVHFDPNTPIPRRILAFGRWEAKEFVSYDHRVGTYGRLEASIVEMLVDLIPEGGERMSGVRLRVICNVGAAGLLTGEEEGFVLTIPGAPFGPFHQLVPGVGITFISTPDEEKD